MILKCPCSKLKGIDVRSNMYRRENDGKEEAARCNVKPSYPRNASCSSVLKDYDGVCEEKESWLTGCVRSRRKHSLISSNWLIFFNSLLSHKKAQKNSSNRFESHLIETSRKFSSSAIRIALCLHPIPVKPIDSFLWFDRCVFHSFTHAKQHQTRSRPEIKAEWIEISASERRNENSENGCEEKSWK